MGYRLIIIMLVAQAIGIAILTGLGLALVNRTRQAAVLWLLAVIMRRRLPLAAEFSALGDGVLLRDRARVARAAGRLRGGASLGEALAAVPGLVSEDSALLTRVGERSRRVGETLAVEAERLARLREATLSSVTSPGLMLMYLIAVPVSLATVVSGLMIFIVPKYLKIFSDFGMRLPAVTQGLFEASDTFADYWYLPAAVLFLVLIPADVLWLSLWATGHLPEFPRRLIPGGRGRRASLALRALAVPVEAGRSLDDALEPLAATAEGADRRRYDRLRAAYTQGADPWAALAAEGIVSAREAGLLAAAERAGNLPWALHLLADRIDERRRRRLAVCVEVAQPLAVIAVGGLVATVALAFFLPLVNLVGDPQWTTR